MNSQITRLKLKPFSSTITMGSLLQEIQWICSLRKNIRDPRVSSAIMKSIETIHQCVNSGIDQNGWKTVDWRGSAPSRSAKAAPAARPYGHRNRAMTPIPVLEAPSSIPLAKMEERRDERRDERRNGWHEAADGFRQPHAKYVSKFKKSSGKVEDTILNTILLGKLNKFSNANYNEIKEFITHIIDNGETDMMKCFMKLVFQKAASEEVFCPLYAKLLSELSTRYPVLLTEMANLYSQYMEIFEEVTDPSGENYQQMCERNVEKKYRRGYSQFLAELIKNDVVDTETFMMIITTIIRQVESNLLLKESIKLNEEFADCFMKIMKAIKKESSEEESDEEDSGRFEKLRAIRALLKTDFSGRILPLTTSQDDRLGLSNKARFTFLDIYEGIQKF